MTSLSFPDINVWLAILLADHVGRAAAKKWWDGSTDEVIAFTRFTQLGVLRLLTTAAAMNSQPVTMPEAWAAYDQLFQDERVALMSEPGSMEKRFRELTRSNEGSPKLWADALLVAFAERAGGTVVTFDRALAGRTGNSLLLR